jgi:outer membrane lipoprotein-sorting protein
MKKSALLIVAILFAGAMMIFAGRVQPVEAMADPLATTLSQLDASSKKFVGATADFQWDTLQKIVGETDSQYGTIEFKRAGGVTEMRANVGDTRGGPVGQIVIYSGGKLQLYQPKIDDLKIITPGKDSGQVEMYLTLGFGASGADLEKNWHMQYEGTEPMGGRTVTKLDLTPVQPNKNITHVTIWVDAPGGVMLKQVLYMTSGDVRTSTYTNIKLTSVNEGDFKMPVKKSTKAQYINQ